MTAPKEILLVGFGAVGAVYSLILKRSGLASVTVVARSNYETVKAKGMDFQSRKYGEHKGWRPDRLFPSIEDALDRHYSHVVLTTKAIPEITRTPDLLAPLLSSPYKDTYPPPTYILMQNGLGVEKDLYDFLKGLNQAEEPKIISTAVYIGTQLVDKNVVEHNDFDRVSLGIYRPTSTATSNTPAEESVLQEFGQILKAGGSDVTVVPEIQRIKYTKNFWNCVMGSTAAISRFSLPGIFRPPHLDPGASGETQNPVKDTRSEEALTASQTATKDVPFRSPLIRDNTIPWIHDAFAEIYNLGMVLFPPSEAGPGLDPAIINNMMKNTAAIHVRTDSTHRPSMLVDVEMGRPMELDVVVGEVVRQGRKMGVPMPRIETLYALLLIVQEQLLKSSQTQKAYVDASHL